MKQYLKRKQSNAVIVDIEMRDPGPLKPNTGMILFRLNIKTIVVYLFILLSNESIDQFNLHNSKQMR